MDEEISNSSLNFVNPSEIELGSTIVELSRRQTCILHSARWHSRRYVLKSLRNEYASNPVYIAALRKEFELGVSLDHTNIIRVVAFEEIATLGKCIVMEWVDGEPLNKFLKSGVTRSERRAIAIQLAGALAYMHQSGVSHRDLKPDNILITHRGHNAKIIDFGLGDADSFTTMKASRATATYGAPEQQGAPSVADTAADVYSFGKILQRLLPKWEKRRLIRKCLRTDPAQRVTMAEVATSLSSRKTRHISIAILIAAIACAGAVALRDRLRITAPATINETTQQHIDTIYIAVPDTADSTPITVPTTTSPVPATPAKPEPAVTGHTPKTSTTGDSIFNIYKHATQTNVNDTKARLINSSSTEENALILADYAKRNEEIADEMAKELDRHGYSDMETGSMINSLYIYMSRFAQELTESGIPGYNQPQQ